MACGEMSAATKRVAVIAAPNLHAGDCGCENRERGAITHLSPPALSMLGRDAQPEPDQRRAHQPLERAAHVAAAQEVAGARDRKRVERQPGECHQAERGAEQQQMQEGAVARDGELGATGW